tara:strand:- start:110 stop:769 length:660 start_codon:yes stop_codon:yes gene_type:complete
MGYLNNTSVTVDAILTNKGRQLLSQGDGTFNITQFALADDEVDYTLWNPDHPLGTDYYGVIIENMPVTEAIPEQTQAMKYRLLTLDNNNTTNIPVVQVIPVSIPELNSGQPVIIKASTFGLNNANSMYGYTAILSDSSVAWISAAAGNEINSNILPTVPQINTGDATSISVISKGEFSLTAKSLPTSKEATITIIANETGGSATVNVTVLPVTLRTATR